MFKKLTILSDNMVQRFLPDPFLFAIILTFIAFALGMIFTPSSAQDMVTYWGDGFFDLLTFAMQMILIFVGGFVLAETPLFKRFIKKIVSIIKSPTQALVLVALISAVLCWINWGLGLVLGAVLAREIAKNVPNVDYRLLIAAAYSGFITFHAGISGSVPLLIATEGHFMQDLIGIVPTSETIFSTFNLILSATIIIALPIIFRVMYAYTKDRDTVSVDPSVFKDEEDVEEVSKKKLTPAERVENSRIISLLVVLLGGWYVVYSFTQTGFDLNLEIVIIVFLVIGVLLHGTPINFLKSVYNSVKGVGGMVIQFPFYAGIMGMIVSSGLAIEISTWILTFATDTTFAFISFISAAIMNIFVPSAGGQWAVQAHVLLPAGAELGVEPAKTALAFLWGEVWTNLIQPFWALPALAIAGLKARDIMGFCLIVLLVTGVILATFMFFL